MHLNKIESATKTATAVTAYRQSYRSLQTLRFGCAPQMSARCAFDIEKGVLPWRIAIQRSRLCLFAPRFGAKRDAREPSVIAWREFVAIFLLLEQHKRHDHF